jgi:hypothetical protein
MSFRLRAFALHVLASISVLSLVLGGLYFGWYRWPGWYLSTALSVVPTLIGVDVALGPLITLLIANPTKPRRALVRDIGCIALVQLVALVYGTLTLWSGRPLYYAFSQDRLQLVQALDLKGPELERARQENPALAPHWYSRPRWVWAPLPSDGDERQRIIMSALAGGDDVIDMPRYFKPWAEGLSALRGKLKSVEALAREDIRLRRHKLDMQQRVAATGLGADQAVALMLTGRSAPMLAIFDPKDLRLRAFVRSDR